jgi:hypothetical protein
LGGISGLPLMNTQDQSLSSTQVSTIPDAIIDKRLFRRIVLPAFC